MLYRQNGKLVRGAGGKMMGYRTDTPVPPQYISADLWATGNDDCTLLPVTLGQESYINEAGKYPGDTCCVVSGSEWIKYEWKTWVGGDAPEASNSGIC